MDTTQIKLLLNVLGRSSIEAGILVLLVCAVRWLFRKQLTPQWRCALWLLVAIRLLLPFSFSSVTSVFNLLPSWAPPSSSPPLLQLPLPTPEVVGHLPLAMRGTLAVPTPATSVSVAAAPHPHQSHWPLFILVTWLSGVTVLAAHTLFFSIRLWRRCARLQPVTDPTVLAILKECCLLLNLRATPILLESVEVTTPALYGLIRPRLLLPRGFLTRFSAAELRFVFLHELAHLKRRDLWLNWLMAALQVVHWFNPLVWFGFGCWRADREFACDAMALQLAGEDRREEYGRTILRLLETFVRPVSTPALVGILQDKRRLRQRIHLIANYAPAAKWSVLALLLATGLAAIGLTDARNQSSDHHATNVQITMVDGRQPQFDVIGVETITNGAPTNNNTGVNLTAPGTSANLEPQENAPVALASSDIANELIGTWALVGTPGHVGKVPTAGARLKFFTGKYSCMTQSDAKTGVVMFHHGGTYSLDGNEYTESLQYAGASLINSLGHTNGHFTIKIDDNLLTSIGKDNPWKEVWERVDDPSATDGSQLSKDLIGTWVLVGSPGNVGPIPSSGRGFKFITASHWLVTQADEKTGVVVIHHGGTYTLKGNRYTETVQYADPSSVNFIGREFNFTIKVEGDTLTSTGTDNSWNEVWKRAP